MEIVKSPTTIHGIRVVQDEEEARKALMNGETVCRFEYGKSMEPILRNGEYAKLTPITNVDEIKRGDAVFCRVHGVLMTHMVWEISDCSYNGEKWFKIGSSMSSIFGWTNEVYAIARGMNVQEKEEGFNNWWLNRFKEKN